MTLVTFFAQARFRESRKKKNNNTTITSRFLAQEKARFSAGGDTHAPRRAPAPWRLLWLPVGWLDLPKTVRALVLFYTELEKIEDLFSILLQ